MVIQLNNEDISSEAQSIGELQEHHPSIVEKAEQFKQLDLIKVGELNSLYVGQGEYAVIPGTDELPLTVGSDHATTCHIAIFLHRSTSTCAVAHLDNRIMQGDSLASIMQQMEYLDGSLVDIDVHVIGGYASDNCAKDSEDDKNCSESISSTLLQFMTASSVTFNIKLWCTCDLNTQPNAFRPTLTSLAINRQTGDVYPADFSARFPVPVMRSAFFWTKGSDDMVNIYDPILRAVCVCPFHNWQQERFALLSKLSNTRLLKYFSTSPLVEPPAFCERLRNTFLLLGNSNSIFDNDYNKYFKLNGKGLWEEIYPHEDLV